MSRRKDPAIPADLLDQLLAGTDAATALDQGGLLDSLKKALAERALNAEMDHHLGGDEQSGNSRNGLVLSPLTTMSRVISDVLADVPRGNAVREFAAGAFEWRAREAGRRETRRRFSYHRLPRTAETSGGDCRADFHRRPSACRADAGRT